MLRLLRIALVTCVGLPLVSTLAAAREADAAPKAAGEDDDYIRFVEDDKRGQLQTAVVHYKHPEDTTTVDLIGVVHIGDAAYYEALNESFKGYDALLFEMVGADPDKPITKEDLQKNKKNPLRFFQILIAKLMALEFQLDGINYTAPNFVHADMDLETFTERQSERGENVFNLVEKGIVSQEDAAARGEETFDMAALMSLFGDDATPDSNKLALGRQFHHIEGMISGMEGQDGSVLVAERNVTALKVLEREIADGKKKLGIFYGGAHLPDFDKRLRGDFGYERIGVTWNTAWDVDKAQIEKRPEEPAGGEGEADPAVPAEQKKAA